MNLNHEQQPRIRNNYHESMKEVQMSQQGDHDTLTSTKRWREEVSRSWSWQQCGYIADPSQILQQLEEQH